ncbi:MAG: LysE family translocator [Candidatus Omnitrophica bacterium]|nr:LysE family translocator [Candidatus Omnitrophota bacterium]
MEYLKIAWLSFLIALSGALIPGPLLAVVIAQSSKRGFKSGPLICLGHAFLEFIMVIILAVGVAKIKHMSLVISTIGLLGTSILFWLGISMLISISKISFENIDKKEAMNNSFILGLTVSLANPYWLFWWLTIGAGLVLASLKKGIVGLTIFFISHISADFAWYSCIAWGCYQGKKLISQKVYKIMIAICGTALIISAIVFLMGILTKRF